MHWTRGPSNVPRRTLLTPRNRRDRSLWRPKPPGSRSPVTLKPVVRRLYPKDLCPKTAIRRSAFNGLLLQRLGNFGTSPRRTWFRDRFAAWAFPRIATDPKAHCNGILAQPPQTQPRVEPAWRLGWLASPDHPQDEPRRVNPAAAPTDRTVPPEGFPVPGSVRPKAPHSGCRSSQPIRRRATLSGRPEPPKRPQPFDLSVIRPFAERCNPKAAPRVPGPEIPSASVA